MIFEIIANKLCKVKFISRFITPESLGQFCRYAITGLTSAAIEFSLLYIFRDIAKLSVVLSNSFALSITFWFNFFINRSWSFKSTGNLKKQLVMYFFLFVFNLAASDAIMYLLTEKLSISYLLAKIFAIGAIVGWNFIIYRKVIYK